MTDRNQVYRCDLCKGIVEVLNPGSEPSCCGQEMSLLAENSVDAAREKHVPVIEQIEGGYKVTVGSVEHPMVENHYIQWIELITDTEVLRHYLKPGEHPVAVFRTEATQVTAREYCNLHGLWKAEH